jgi:hypothetical protein
MYIPVYLISLPLLGQTLPDLNIAQVPFCSSYLLSITILLVTRNFCHLLLWSPFILSETLMCSISLITRILIAVRMVGGG